jgi:HK97 family phage major capsid protein
MFKKLLEAKIKEQESILAVALAESRAMTEEDREKFMRLQTEINNLEATLGFSNDLEERKKAEKTHIDEPLFAQPKNSHEGLFKNFGEQLLAIVKAGRPGGEIDNRLLKIQNAATGASEGVPSDGGFLVQKDFSGELIKNVYKTGILAPMCKRMPISSNSNGLKINGVDESSRANGSRWGGVQGYWADEAATVTATKPKFRQIELTLKKLMGLYYSTEELLNDSFAMESVLMQAFTEEIQFKLDDAIFRGPGAGQPLGILKSGALITQAAEAAQLADTVIFENISKMWSRLVSSSRANAVWFINQEIEPQLYSMYLAVGIGGVPVYMPAGGLSGQPYGTLFGRPVIPIEHCSALGDVGDVVLADMSQYLLADKGGIQTASSVHVQFLYDEIAFRITYRVDGQPTRNSVITPYKGANSLSSFVTLAAR